MKNVTGLSTALFLALIGSACSSLEKSSQLIVLTNPSAHPRSEIVKIDANVLQATTKIAPVEGMGKIGAIPVEVVDQDGNGSLDYFLASVTMNPEESLELAIGKWKPDHTFKKRTQAEISTAMGGQWTDRKYLGGTGFENTDYLRVPSSHTDHSWYIRYEGPGWENELIGYRFYLDWRNAGDIFGKKVDTLVLQHVGQDGFDSYHLEAPWGMDILKAGKSLGIGSIGRINGNNVVEHFNQTDSMTCKIIRSGYLSSRIETNYYGWKTGPGICDMKSELSIESGDRATTHKVTFNTVTDNICTGIVKHPAGAFFEATSGDWGYVATFGAQTLFDDNLGMAILYKTGQLLKIDTTDSFNHLVIFKPSKNIEYQFLGAWEKEPGGIHNKEAFEKYLNQKLDDLNAPIEITSDKK